MSTGLFSVWRLMVIAGWRNRIARQLQRLRRPRYLFATIVGLAYFVWVFGLQRRSMDFGSAAPPEFRFTMEVMFTAFGLLAVLMAWIFGSDRAVLNFTEAEAQFFFPSPYSRRQLLRFKLLRALGRTIFSAALTTLFVGRGMEHKGFLFVGVFFALSTLSFHVVGASFLREALVDFGWSGLFRRVLPILLFAVAVGGTLLFTWNRTPPPDLTSGAAALTWARSVLDTPPLSWLLFPIRAPIHVAMAQSWPEFLRAIPAAALVFAVHYFWVERSDVAFEEASLRYAERRAQWIEARRSNRAGTPTGQVASWKLSIPGAPEMAIIWKNLIAARRVYSLRVLPTLLLIAGGLAAASIFLVPRRGGGGTFAIGFFCAIAAVLLVLIGPSAVRIDLRQDLPAIDVLRAWPLSGFQVMRAEVFGAALVLGGLQWLLLAAAFGFTSNSTVPLFGSAERLAILTALLLLCPALSLAGLVVQNTAALLFPSWVTPEPNQQRGVEMMGQRLLTLLGTWVVLLIVVLPVGAVGAALSFVLLPFLGFWSAAVGALFMAAVFVAGALAATYAMGRLFERFDPTE